MALAGSDSERSDGETDSGSSRPVVSDPDDAYFVAIPVADIDVEENDRRITVETTDGNEVVLRVEEFDDVRLATAIHRQERLDGDQPE